MQTSFSFCNLSNILTVSGVMALGMCTGVVIVKMAIEKARKN
jgi:hypothetical protein